MRRLLRFSILTWPRISKFLSRIVWTIHGHVLREWTRCVFLKLFVFFVPTMFSVRIQQLCIFFFWSARKHSWKYVLLSALLRNQSCLQSSSCFQHQFVRLLFLEPLFARVGNYLFFRVHGSTRFVSSSLSYVDVSRSREKQLRQASA